MDDETTVDEETLDTQEEETLEPQEDTSDDEPQDDDIDWEARAKKAEELAKNYKTRAEKAEKKAKEPKESTDTEGFSLADQMAILKAGVELEDLDDVVDFAKAKKTSIAQALQSATLKALLTERNEERKSAQVVNTGKTRRASTEVSDDALLANARKGVMPENDADIARLSKLRILRK